MKSAGGILRAVERASSPAAGAVASEGGSRKRSRAWQAAQAAKAAKAASVAVGVAGVVATGLGALGIGPLSVPISGARSYLADKWAGAGTGVGEGWPAHVQSVTVAACIGGLKSELAKAKSAQTTPTKDNVAYDDQIRSGAKAHGIREHAELFREMLISIDAGARNPPGIPRRTPIMDRVVFRYHATNAESGRIFTLFVSPIHAAWHGVEREAMYPQYAARELYAGFESFGRDHGAGTWNVTVCVDNEELGVYTRAFADAARVVTYRQEDWAGGAETGQKASMSRVKNPAVLARDATAVGLCVDRCHGKRRVGLMVLSDGAPGGAAAEGKHSVDLGVVDDDNQTTHEASVVSAWLRGETLGVHATGDREAREARADELFVGTIAGRWAVDSHQPYHAEERTDYSDAWVVRDARLGLVDSHAATLVFVKVPQTNLCAGSEMQYVARAVEAGLDAMIAEGIRVAIIAPSSCFHRDGTDSFVSIVDAALDRDYKSPRAQRVDVVADGRATNPSESVRRHFFAEVLIPTLVGLSSATSRSSRFGCDVPRRFV